MNTAIEDFLREYKRSRDYYAKVASLCEERLTALLKSANIRAITSSRAKKIASLKDKLAERSNNRAADGVPPYADNTDILTNIRDLAGARVALYFPADMQRASEIISANFIDTQSPKQFPLSTATRAGKRFLGYVATHHRVKLPASADDDDSRYGDAVCEIQIASVLMHAWSEVEHDLEYKQLYDAVSSEESALLDQLNGLVIAGEIALSQLQDAMKRRLKSKNDSLRDHYDLANWLLSVESEARPGREIRNVGDADYGYRFLKLLHMTSIQSLQQLKGKLVQNLAVDGRDDTLADTLRDLLLLEDPANAALLQIARDDTREAQGESIASTEKQIGAFIKSWVEFDWLLQIAAMLNGQIIRSPRMASRFAQLVLPATLRAVHDRFRRLRNSVVHHPADNILQLDTVVRDFDSFTNEAITAMFSDNALGYKDWLSGEPPQLHVRVLAAFGSPESELVCVALGLEGDDQQHTQSRAILHIQNVTYRALYVLALNNNVWGRVRKPTDAHVEPFTSRLIFAFSLPGFIINDELKRASVTRLTISMDGARVSCQFELSRAT